MNSSENLAVIVSFRQLIEIIRKFGIILKYPREERHKRKNWQPAISRCFPNSMPLGPLCGRVSRAEWMPGMIRQKWPWKV